MNILIFGGTSGIGRALVEQYAKAGHQVIFTGRREEKLVEISRHLGPSVLGIRHDIRQTELTPGILQQAEAKFGPIDLIIVNAGIGKFNYDLDWDICLSVLKTNVLGVTRALLAGYNYFRQQGQGHLVNVSSVASLIGGAPNPSYNASKAYQANFMEALWIKAHKSRKNKIAVTDIRPGFVDTKLAQGAKFWKADVQTAAQQIRQAIAKKKKIAYITRRWAVVAMLLKHLPSFVLKKM